MYLSIRAAILAIQGGTATHGMSANDPGVAGQCSSSIFSGVPNASSQRLGALLSPTSIMATFDESLPFDFYFIMPYPSSFFRGSLPLNRSIIVVLYVFCLHLELAPVMYI